MAEKIEIEIVLDDGSIATGFAKIKKGAKSAGKSVEKDLAKPLSKLTTVTRSIRNNFLSLQGLIAGGVIVASVNKIVRSFSDFESALIGVGKTADKTDAELKKIGQDFLKLSLVIPTTAEDLARLGETAGQLGIKSSANIVKFTEVMSRLDASVTGINVNELAVQMARISKLTGTNIKDVDKLGSSLVALGNDFAANEGQIAKNAIEIAKATAVYNVGGAAVLGLATAFQVSGVEAEVSRTAVLKTFNAFRKSIGATNPKAKLFNEILGTTTKEFADLAKGSPEVLLQKLVNGLSKLSATDAGNTLDALGLSEIRTSTALLGLTKNVDTLNEAMATSNKAFIENKALMQESEKAFASVKNQTKLLGNAFTKLQIELGQKFKDDILGFISALTTLVKNAPAIIERLGRITLEIVALGGAFLAFKNRGIISSFITSIFDVVKALRLSKVAALSNVRAYGLMGKASIASSRALKVLTISAKVLKATLSLGLLLAVDAVIEKFIELSNLTDLQKINKSIAQTKMELASLQELATNGVRLQEVGRDGRQIEVKIPEDELTEINQKITDANMRLAEQIAQRNVIVKEGNTGLVADLDASLGSINDKTQTALEKQNEALDSLVKKMEKKVKGDLVNAISGVGKALATGGDPVQAFLGTILNTLGDFAIQYGSLAIGIGSVATAMAAALSNPYTGPAAIPLGIALIALGGALKSVGSSTESGGFEAGTAAAGGGTDGADTISEDDIADAIDSKPATEVNIEVTGQVVDPRGTGLQIAELLRDLQDSNGELVVT